ncbi:hypothetical protein FVO59_10940 [Microbacterium esteraromaticum]|uniref:DUF4870 domain-containing protein n=1 Tax=Microbacterium esteraromaticum TaxID=57043 RepID=A0A7D7WBP4_9MICO|nr:DUF4870 domain-containing protein [Microbacterium esteraromaticum]QMU97675.1 hypothetical protein FVO59_10940 [Microbacterium esteraromaticum]
MTATSAPATGASAWALGLLVLLPIPLLGPLAAGGGMIAAYGSLSRQGPLAKRNAAAARSWGRLFLFVSTALLVVQLVVGLVRMTQPSAPATGFFPQGIPITLYVIVCVVHLVVVIVALRTARRGEFVRVPFVRSL